VDLDPFVVACIPAFNEQSAIGGVLIRTKRHVDKVVVCDDGSKDLTGEIAKGLGAVIASHERNMGYGASISTLFSEALRLGADIAVTLDGDGQHDPEEIPRLIERLAVGDVDIVVGSRFLEQSSSHAPRWRRAGIKLITELASNGSLELTDAQSGFRAYTRKALESIVLTEQGMGVSTEILLKAGVNGLKIAEVPVNITYGKSSSTHNPVIHGLEVVLTTIKHLSLRKPLLFYGLPGLIALTTALFFWVWTLQIFAATRRVITNIALIALGSTLIGLMLMTTAVILWVMISIMQEKIG
jgi:glycosyltransferase involved in cell wall biosynthesis